MFKVDLGGGDFITEKDCEIDDDNFVICRNIKLHITRENLSDFEIQTGMHRLELIKHHYLNSIVYQRNEKINKILDDEL